MSSRPLASDRDLAVWGRVGNGSYIRDLRGEAGMSQKALGAAVGLTGDMISKVENGVAGFPSRHAPEFAQALGVDARQFARTIFSYIEPWLFVMIYPKVGIDAEINEQAATKVSMTLNRKAALRSAKRARERA